MKKPCLLNKEARRMMRLRIKCSSACRLFRGMAAACVAGLIAWRLFAVVWSGRWSRWGSRGARC